MEGTISCNSYGVRYALAGSDFRFTEDLGKTDFDCGASQDVRQQEAAFFKIMENPATLKATRDRLEIGAAGGDGTLVFVPKEQPSIDPALEGVGWVLTSLNGNALLEGTRITLEFDDDGGVSGEATCNLYGSNEVEAAGGSFKITGFDMTSMGCPGKQGRQEEAYLDALTHVSAYQVGDDRLNLQNAAGETILVYEKEP